MFGEYDLLVWLLVGLGGLIALFRLLIIPFFKELQKAGHKKQKIDDAVEQEISVRNLGHVAADFATKEVSKYMQGLKIAHSQSMALYKEQKDKGATPEVLQPLEKKIKQIEFFLTHEKEIDMANKLLTGPIIGKFAGKILGAFL